MCTRLVCVQHSAFNGKLKTGRIAKLNVQGKREKIGIEESSIFSPFLLFFLFLSLHLKVQSCSSGCVLCSTKETKEMRRHVNRTEKQERERERGRKKEAWTFSIVNFHLVLGSFHPSLFSACEDFVHIFNVYTLHSILYIRVLQQKQEENEKKRSRKENSFHEKKRVFLYYFSLRA